MEDKKSWKLLQIFPRFNFFVNEILSYFNNILVVVTESVVFLVQYHWWPIYNPISMSYL
jgi:hypothetical protein